LKPARRCQNLQVKQRRATTPLQGSDAGSLSHEQDFSVQSRARVHRPYEMPMDSTRLFYCVRCNAQVLVCRRCDRGQTHCGSSCSKQSRRTSVREAGRRYQRTRQGRIKHADRMREYRAREKQKVTHHGSPLSGSTALLRVDTLPPKVIRAVVTHTDYRCHFCRNPCSDWLRRNFIKRRGSGVAICNTRRSHREKKPP
jgi:hypothetical protein